MPPERLTGLWPLTPTEAARTVNPVYRAPPRTATGTAQLHDATRSAPEACSERPPGFLIDGSPGSPIFSGADKPLRAAVFEQAGVGVRRPAM